MAARVGKLMEAVMEYLLSSSNSAKVTLEQSLAKLANDMDVVFKECQTRKLSDCKPYDLEQFQLAANKLTMVFTRLDEPGPNEVPLPKFL